MCKVVGILVAWAGRQCHRPERQALARAPGCQSAEARSPFPAPWHTALGHALVVGLLKGGVRGRVLVLTRRFGVDMYVRSGLTAGDASEVVSEPEVSKRVRASVAQAILLARSRSEGRRPAREALGVRLAARLGLGGSGAAGETVKGEADGEAEAEERPVMVPGSKRTGLIAYKVSCRSAYPIACIAANLKT